jgi:hypothetical protein
MTGRNAVRPRLLLMAAAAAALITVCACARRSAGGPAGSAPRAAVAPPGHADRFGITGGTRGRDVPQLMRELGVGWMRIPVNWYEVEPRADLSLWKQVEQVIAEYRRTYPGLHFMVTLRARSPWAGEKAPAKVSPKATLPPRDLDAYYRFVLGMAARGRGVVECWQIENEEDSGAWWAGTAAQYLELLRTAHRAIRAADPQAKIALGGFTSEMTTVASGLAQGRDKSEIARQLGVKGPVDPRAEAWVRPSLDQMEAILAGAGPYIDVVDIHLYNDYHSIPDRVQWLRDRMRAHGYEKPIWATEVGGPDTAVDPFSETAQAEQVEKRVALALASGVEKVFWLGLHDMRNQGPRWDHLGLVTAAGVKKPAFRVYQALIRTLGNLPASHLEVPGGYGARFGEGASARWLLWSDRGVRYRLAVRSSAVRVVSVSGATRLLQADKGAVQLSLNGSPVLVEATPNSPSPAT